MCSRSQKTEREREKKDRDLGSEEETIDCALRNFADLDLSECTRGEGGKKI